MRPERVRILGIPVDAVDFQGALSWVEWAVGQPGFKRIVAVNPEKVMAAQKDSDLKAFLEESDLLIPDGIGVVKAARLLGLARMERVAGSDLMPAICALAAGSGYRIFIYGSRPEVNEKAREILKKRFPGLSIVGWSHGYVRPEEMNGLIERINASGADILFIALGSPKQEKWMAKHGPSLSVKVAQGIGGTLDTIAGNVKRAPAIFRDLNLEWLYRLITNPRRARRQAVLPIFAWRVLKERLGRGGN